MDLTIADQKWCPYTGNPDVPQLRDPGCPLTTLEQNGLVERFFRSLKEECVWQHRFETFEEARSTISQWIDWYNNDRPHQALGYLSPAQYRTQQLKSVA